MAEVPAVAFDKEVHGAAEATRAFRLTSQYDENRFVGLIIQAKGRLCLLTAILAVLVQTSIILEAAGAMSSSSSPTASPRPSSVASSRDAAVCRTRSFFRVLIEDVVTHGQTNKAPTKALLEARSRSDLGVRGGAIQRDCFRQLIVVYNTKT